MQLVGVAHQRPGLGGHLRDGLGIERSGAGGKIGRERAAQLHGAGAALFERRIVEEGVRVCVQDLVRERRGLGGVDGHGLDGARLNSLQHGVQAVQVHGLVQAIADGLFDERMVGDSNLAHQVLGAGRLVRKHGRQQVVRSHALYGRGHLAPAGEAQNGERAGNVPTPASGEHGGSEQGLREQMLHRLRPQELEDDLERERMLLGERNDDAVVGGRGLQFEIEGAAEALAQRQSPGAVDAGAEGGVENELHAAGLVEESLGDHAARRWKRG